MITQHTPGPWSAFIKKQTVAIDIGPQATGKRPCVVDWSGFDASDLPLTVQKANARLIASAPELLKVLKLYEEVWDEMFAHFCSNGMLNRWGKEFNCSKLNEAHRIGEKVIAKATGQLPPPHQPKPASSGLFYAWSTHANPASARRCAAPCPAHTGRNRPSHARGQAG
jgi:hypothetical protein